MQPIIYGYKISLHIIIDSVRQGHMWVAAFQNVPILLFVVKASDSVLKISIEQTQLRWIVRLQLFTC